MVDYSEPLAPARDARLRARLAQAHIRAGDANGFDAAVATLVQIAVGKDENGKALKVAPRTRVQAAQALLRSAAIIMKAMESDEDLRKGVPPQIVFNIGVPELRTVEVKAVETKPEPLALPPVPPAAPETNGHTNGEAKP